MFQKLSQAPPSPFVLSAHHCFEALGERLLLNVDTSLFYRINNVVFDLVTEADRQGWDRAVTTIKKRYRAKDVQDAIDYLKREKFFSRGRYNAEKPSLKLRPLSTLELCVTHGCNLNCRYCYGRHDTGNVDPLYGSACTQMPESTAFKAIDIFWEGTGSLKELNLTFFGGEPFLNLPLMQATADYCRKKEKESGKKIRLSVVTNGTLLDAAAINFVKTYGVSVQISIDGPAPVQDYNRPFRDGGGSYTSVLEGMRRLRASGRKHIPARVTAAAGNGDSLEIFRHLINLGFSSVHLEPDLGGGCEGEGLSSDEVDRLIQREEQVARCLVDLIQEGRYANYHGLVRHVRDTRVVHNRRYFYCGAGRGLICVSNEGEFYPCHRFLGIKAYCLGTIDTGIDHQKRVPFNTRHVDTRSGCRECWARYFCGGGCWSHAHNTHGTLDRPDEERSCRLVRRQIELAMAVNALLDVSDQAIISGIFDETTLSYLKTE